MSPELERLIALQQLDARLQEARQALAAFPTRSDALDARLAAAREQLDAARLQLKESQEARRALEKDAAVYQGRLDKFKDQLSAVKTNREYTAMQHEIATAKSALEAAEDKVLERMDEGETLATAVKQAEAALAVEQKQVTAEKQALAEEQQGVHAESERLLAARSALAAQMDARLVGLFEQVAKARKGIAVSSATRDGLCAVCHVRLRPQVFQLVRQNDRIIQCDSCQRILYYTPPPPPVEHPVVHG